MELAQDANERRLVEQIALHQRDAILNVLDAIEVDNAGATHHPDDIVAFVQQELGQVRAVLPGYTGDQSHGFAHGISLTLFRQSSSTSRNVCSNGMVGVQPVRAVNLLASQYAMGVLDGRMRSGSISIRPSAPL